MKKNKNSRICNVYAFVLVVYIARLVLVVLGNCVAGSPSNQAHLQFSNHFYSFAGRMKYTSQDKYVNTTNLNIDQVIEFCVKCCTHKRTHY